MPRHASCLFRPRSHPLGARVLIHTATVLTQTQKDTMCLNGLGVMDRSKTQVVR